MGILSIITAGAIGSILATKYLEKALVDSQVDSWIEDEKIPGVNYKIVKRYLKKLYKSKKITSECFKDEVVFLGVIAKTFYESNKMDVWKELEFEMSTYVLVPDARFVYEDFHKTVEKILEREAIKEKSESQ